MLIKPKKKFWMPSVAPYYKAAGGIPLSLDGTPQTANATTSALALPAFTWSNANDIIVVTVVLNGFPVTSVTGGGLTFAREPGLTPPTGGSSSIEVWYAVASTAQSSVVFTINTTASAFTTGLVFAVTGAKTSAPFDVSGPSTSSSSTNATITTSATHTFAFGLGISAGSTPINGFTNMSATAAGNFLDLNYKIVSTTLSNVSWDSSPITGTIGTAIVQGP